MNEKTKHRSPPETEPTPQTSATADTQPTKPELSVAAQSPLPTRPNWESNLELVKQMCAPNASPQQFEMFLYAARRRGLDPLSRQIHMVFFKERRGSEWIERPVIVTGIDGFRVISERTGRYAGMDPVTLGPLVDAEFVIGSGENRKSETVKVPEYASCTIYKLLPSGQRIPYTATVYFEEFYGSPCYNQQAKRMPRHMLGKCAEAQAHRKAFPDDLAGLYVEEELSGGRVPPEAIMDAEFVVERDPAPVPQASAGAQHLAAAAAAAQPRPATARPPTSDPGDPDDKARAAYFAAHDELNLPPHHHPDCKAMNYSVWSKVLGHPVNSGQQLSPSDWLLLRAYLSALAALLSEGSVTGLKLPSGKTLKVSTVPPVWHEYRLTQAQPKPAESEQEYDPFAEE